MKSPSNLVISGLFPVVLMMAASGCASNPANSNQAADGDGAGRSVAGAIAAGAPMAAVGAVGGAALGAVGGFAYCAPLGPLALVCAPVGAVLGGVGGAISLGRKGAEWGAKAVQGDAPVGTSPVEAHDLAAPGDAPVGTSPVEAHDLAAQSARIGQVAAAEAATAGRFAAPSGRDPSRSEHLPEEPSQPLGTAPAQPQAPPAANLGARTAPDTRPPSANRLAPSQAGLGGLPAAGTTWSYRFSDRQYGRYETNLTVRVLRSGSAVMEEVSGADVPGWQRLVLPKETRIVRHALGGGAELTEFAPYFFDRPEDALPPNASISGYPAGALSSWIVRVGGQRWEEITVPAGSFRAWRIELSGTRERDDYARAQSGRFEMVVWYAPAVKRFVRLEHRTWSVGTLRQSAHEVVELLSHRPPS